MQIKRLFSRLKSTLAVITVALFVTATAASQETVLYSFNNNGTDGFNPWSTLISDASGNLYGTTLYGGVNNKGTVFELTPQGGGSWTETILHSFGTGTDGASPFNSLVLDTAGNLYGTTEVGGTHQFGAVFELTPQKGGKWKEKVLHSFNVSDGAYPLGGLVLDSSGNLYGTTFVGGPHENGNVFELTPEAGGKWKETVLHNFNNNGKDGYGPYEESLILDAAGNLYGTTFLGGKFGLGTIFELIPQASGKWQEKILHSFPSNSSDGELPFAGVIFDVSGNLYCSTSAGGTGGVGTVFELAAKKNGGWKGKVLHNFNDDGDGYDPFSVLILDGAGNLYGTTGGGGTYGDGTVFELTKKGGWNETILHNFNDDGTDGYTPYGGLLRDASGNLYGTTYNGGTYGYGTVFEITP